MLGDFPGCCNSNAARHLCESRNSGPGDGLGKLTGPVLDEAAGLPEWPPYTMEGRQYLVFDHEISRGARLRDRACEVLDGAIDKVYQKSSKE